jgi:uncharacterized protein (TIGR02246 family)
MNHQMKIRLLLLGLLITSCVSPLTEGDSEFKSFLEAYTTAWNTHNGDSVAAYFTSDADLIMGSLPQITGREAIGGWWNTYFSQIDESRKGEFKLLTIKDITPDVRIVNISSKTFGRNMDNEELETRLARGTWILVKRNEIWQIAAMRGLPAEGEQRFRPGVDR